MRSRSSSAKIGFPAFPVVENRKYWLYSVEPSSVTICPPLSMSRSTSVSVSRTLPSVSLSSRMSDWLLMATASPSTVSPCCVWVSGSLMTAVAWSVMPMSMAPATSDAAASSPIIMARLSAGVPCWMNGAGQVERLALASVVPAMMSPIPSAVMHLMSFIVSLFWGVEAKD